MRKEGRPKEAIEMLELAGKSPFYRLKAQVQIGLCHRSTGDYRTAIQLFRAALNDPSASETQVIDIQYFLARTLESVGQFAEAAPLFRRIAKINPRFKDAAYRANELSSKLKHPINGERCGTGNGSWFGNALKSFHRWPLLASREPHVAPRRSCVSIWRQRFLRTGRGRGLELLAARWSPDRWSI